MRVFRTLKLVRSLLLVSMLGVCAAPMPVRAQTESPGQPGAVETPAIEAPEAQTTQREAPAPPPAAQQEAQESAVEATQEAEPATTLADEAVEIDDAAPGEDAADDAVPLEAAPSPSAGDKKPLPHDLSPWGMFEAADIVVKTVMIGLAIASFVTWTVWLAKGVELTSAKRRLRRGIAGINSSDSLHDAVDVLGNSRGPAAALVRAAAEELVQSGPVLDHTGGEGILARVTSRLTRIEAAAARRISMGTGVLATIGATAPFVGLFGTVWGIMNSFIGISETQTTNLAVVAPGIAEALLATALGLVAAIPAVVIYNVFARSTAGYRQLLADAAAGVERLVSRDLDFRRVPAAPPPAMFARAAE